MGFGFQAAWAARMADLLRQIVRPVLLLWLAGQQPPAAGAASLWHTPVLVDAGMIDLLRPLAAEVLEVVPSAAALAGGGPLLLSHPVGESADLERAESGDYLVVRWSEAGMDALLARAGFIVDWTRRDDCGDGVWRTVLARKRA